MFTERRYPTNIPLGQLDEYLAKGWFRTGQAIFTCHFLNFQGDLFDTIWIRLPLKTYQFRKNLRKLLRKNAKCFKIVIQQARIDEDREQLYQIHKNRFEGYVTDTLRESLLDGGYNNLYNSYEIGVYDEERLVAWSCFDKGEDSVASIMGLFHPDYHKHSLGFYTMLLEIQFAQEQGLNYYYPGYVVHKYDKFDYKLRIAPPESIEFFQSRVQKWLPYTQLTPEQIPSEKINLELAKVQKALTKTGIGHRKVLYPLYDKGVSTYPNQDFLESPIFIACHPEQSAPRHLLIEYDYLQDIFRLGWYSRYDDFATFLHFKLYEFNPHISCLGFLLSEYILLESKNIAELVKCIQMEKMTKPIE
ncbi:MAG: GNAT family N-acetyltransferase [Chitinophagales bacterium]